MRIFLLLIASLFSVCSEAQLRITALTCNGLENPMGVNPSDVRLGWRIETDQRNTWQTGYEIFVSTSVAKLEQFTADIWRSGMTRSDNSVNIHYGGRTLQAGKLYYWRVRVQTNHGEAWSAIGSWSTGLSRANWKAKWIGYDKASPWDSITTWSRLSARYFRKDFRAAAQIKRATLYISGLGLCEIHINGKKLFKERVAAAPTDYRKRVFYSVYDVADMLNKGENAIGIVVGNGRYFTMRQNYKPKKINNFGFPKLFCQLAIEYSDGTKTTIGSDASWKLNVDGPIRTNNEYDGEEYDATKEWRDWSAPGFDDRLWMKPQLVAAPAGKLEAQPNPPVSVSRLVRPVSIRPLRENVYIMDMGQNFSGWIQMKVAGERGRQVCLRFAESLQADGSLYTANLRDARVTDVYTLRGSGEETWEPSFVYHGFRYVEITNYPGVPQVDAFEGKLFTDEMETTGSFSCSDSVINKIYRNAWWGIASNYKGMPVDCPQRNERQPWLGDRATGSGGEAFVFDNHALYSKWLNDIEDAQTAEGAIPDVAPAFWNYYTDNVTWPGTYLLVARMLFHQYGDAEPIRKHYASMKKWMEYMRVHYLKDNILTKDKYGDWCVPPESLELIRSRDSLRNTNGALIATAYYYQFLGYMKEFAQLAGHAADSTEYNELAGRIRVAFNQKFFDAAGRKYDNNTITANLLPLQFGLVEEEYRDAVFANIVQRITGQDNYHISTGVIGTQWLMRMLSRMGRADIAYRLASTTSYPGWGYMTTQGATTIWELWNGNTASPQMNSQNHVMLLGDLLIWLYEDIAGIKTDPLQPGFKHILMKPDFSCGLDQVNASYRSVYGNIESAWKKTGKNIEWTVTVPANAGATLLLPSAAQQLVQDGQTAEASIVKIGSGTYRFSFQLN